ncbi:hypothetical protein ACSX1A_04020 [Pontibacter sp. MBLB2868]|uniref:hypothetical protein n=1 Tax=Pontibacter sp. MBLB2868 TaxID=3451555 RepID=UPI003F7513D9
MKKNRIVTFYMEQQVDDQNGEGLYTKSAAKPRLLLNKLKAEGYAACLDIREFAPFEQETFYLAHTREYVDKFFQGAELPLKSGLAWSENLATSVRYTNASLYHAILHAVLHPDELTFSPTSGFHHARPESGAGFCTFSGQVIVSVKIYREFGLCGAYLDLDQHFGNSIEDSRAFVTDLDVAIPKMANINVRGTNEGYISHLGQSLSMLKQCILAGKIHYVVWCHGADSHVFDHMGGSVNTEYWMMAAEMFYKWVLEVEQELGQPLPVIMSLFGGYRPDDYDSVLSLHMADLLLANRILLGKDTIYKPHVKESDRKLMDPITLAIANGETILGCVP